MNVILMSADDTLVMKSLSVIIFAVVMASAFAEDSSQRAFPDAGVKKKQVADTKSTRAYKKAKEACVNSSDGKLKGKKLTECIVNYQKEAK